MSIDIKRNRYPFCIVWTPIPILTWLFPFIGHMGITTSQGIIKDFAMSHTISTDNIAFGNPTRYLQLDPHLVDGDKDAWDQATSHACEVYSQRTHNLILDNCHSHVALALSTMRYNGRDSWNMVILAAWMFFCGKYVNLLGFVKTWLPFLTMVLVILAFIFLIP
ncbi:transmembrane protein 222 [Tetranychus urticae]|uniref:Transmembrane protein 222 n=1 Tax=Tetranychus urticae TaxID=32264 RepID=T1K652_TETUR|nr:transmembrane protein 222 [Tetranychus urticae]XP_015782360.1 transmembrane protein 222 [Tetranychus urticae]